MVPDEISIVGIDDISFSSRTPVQLTTIRAPLQELGRRAAEILIKNIESHEILPLENVVLSAELVVRGSTKTLLPSLVGKLQDTNDNQAGVSSQSERHAADH